MTTRLISHLRHVDLAVNDYDSQLDFYTDLWGLTQVASEPGLAFLAAEGSPEPYVVRVRRSPDKRVDLIAFASPDEASVDTLAAQLLGDGTRLITQPGALTTPGGGYGFRFFDIDGRTVEISANVAPRPYRAIEERESIPVKLSHVLLNSTDPMASSNWYQRVLGLRLSDLLAVPGRGTIGCFLRCNPEHHSIGFTHGPHTSLNHLSFEMRGIDEYLRGTGRLLQAGANKLWGPGRHRVGDNTFTYFLDPNGNVMEYTTALQQVDDATWEPQTFDVTQPGVADQWGIAGSPEFLVKEHDNEPDRGIFIAPPV